MPPCPRPEVWPEARPEMDVFPVESDPVGQAFGPATEAVGTSGWQKQWPLESNLANSCLHKARMYVRPAIMKGVSAMHKAQGCAFRGWVRYLDTPLLSAQIVVQAVTQPASRPN